MLQLKRKVLFHTTASEGHFNGIFAGEAVKVESPQHLSQLIDSLPQLYRNKDPYIFKILAAIEEISVSCAYPSPGLLANELYTEKVSYTVFFSLIN
jgi:hypothetical protein